MKSARGTLLAVAALLFLSACETPDPQEYVGVWEYAEGSRVTEICGNDRTTIDVTGEVVIEASGVDLLFQFNGCSVLYDAPGAGNVFSTEEHHFCDSMGIDIDTSELALHGDTITQREHGHFFDGMRCTYELNATLVWVSDLPPHGP